MGKISDAIEQIEDELEDAIKEIQRLEKINEKLNERVTELALIIEHYNGMEDYMEEYHPGIVTAFEVAQRMEK
jgi:chaperonin cofactor prefoldin